MTNSKFHLFQLQKIDTRLSTLKTERERIILQLENDPVLLNAKQRLTKYSVEHQELINKLAETETQIGTRRIKKEQSENNLYQGKITNPKELQDLQKEISIIQKQIKDLEEFQLDFLYRLESKQKELSTAELELVSAKNNNELNNEMLHKKIDTIIAEQSKLTSEKSAILSQLSADIIKIYDELRTRKKGLAVSKVEEGACGICGGSLTPSDHQQAKSPNLITFCPSCGRILYAD